MASLGLRRRHPLLDPVLDDEPPPSVPLGGSRNEVWALVLALAAMAVLVLAFWLEATR